MPAAIRMKRLYSLDLPGPSDEPEDLEDCWVRVNVDIGLATSDAADTFRLIVCTPRALSRDLANTRGTWGAQLLVLPRFDWETVTAALAEKISEVASRATSWEDFVQRFGCFAAWEFDDADEPPAA